jgi:hypothetical protein
MVQKQLRDIISGRIPPRFLDRQRYEFNSYCEVEACQTCYYNNRSVETWSIEMAYFDKNWCPKDFSK